MMQGVGTMPPLLVRSPSGGTRKRWMGQREKKKEIRATRDTPPAARTEKDREPSNSRARTAYTTTKSLLAGAVRPFRLEVRYFGSPSGGNDVGDGAVGMRVMDLMRDGWMAAAVDVPDRPLFADGGLVLKEAVITPNNIINTEYNLWKM
jgi:hypothetical protein